MINVPLYLNGPGSEMPCPCCVKTLKEVPRHWEEPGVGPHDLVFYCNDCEITIYISK